ncbi:MAG: adenylate/guanylate cyclase domain-containing protein [Firmicutes bacterium]|nr:adenylate/guanylate cyclase domain-containing protein [[Eubacterium] siraeum]MCM1488138.1 adenylate/guanylate cyclase domain-containing protein [Bacillota bacterium]
MKRILVALLFAAVTFFCIFCGWTDVLDKNAEDFLYHRPSGTSDRIKIIKIDDKSISRLGDYSEWDRGIYADLVERLCVSEDIKPAVIAFDLLFDSGGETEQDIRFARVCKNQGNVICAFSYVFERVPAVGSDDELRISSLAASSTVMPYQRLYEATRHGFANALMDSDDGIIRSSFLRYPFDASSEASAEYSLNAAAYRLYANNTGISDELPDGSYFSFRYSGEAGDFENVPLCDVLDGTIPAEAFSDCIVLVGAYTAGMMDSYYVPVDKGQQMYGVEIHANAIQALMEKKLLYSAPKWADGLICALIAGIICFLCGGISVSRVVALCLISAAAKLIAGFLSFNGAFSGGIGYKTDVTALPIVLLAVMGYFMAAHYYTARKAKKQIEGAFKKYVAPQVVSEIAKSGSYEIKLGGENRDIAVLFVDIRGFTPLSESLEPQQVVNILNSYLELTADCIFKHGGTLDKFVGDAAMAVFNAPFDLEDYVFRAVLTALDIANGSEKIDEECMRLCGKHVGFGVGVNCGPAVVGNIGCDFRMDYTAIGDTVNTAARLEANAPKGTVYISDSVYNAVRDRIQAEEVGEIPLKGKSKGVFVYSLKGIKENEEIKEKERQQ